MDGSNSSFDHARAIEQIHRYFGSDEECGDAPTVSLIREMNIAKVTFAPGRDVYVDISAKEIKCFWPRWAIVSGLAKGWGQNVV